MISATTKWTGALLLTFAVAVAVTLPGRSVFAQVGKPDAAVAPLGALGDIGEGEKSILFSSLLSNLSQRYRLVSQEEYARAEEKAFAELESEQCTAEQCIRKIQEILQVERLFVLQVVREGAFSHLSLTLVRDDDNIVREAICEKCKISGLHGKLKNLVGMVAAADLRERRAVAGQEPALTPAPPSAEARQEPTQALPSEIVTETLPLDKAVSGAEYFQGGGLLLVASAYYYRQATTLHQEAKDNRRNVTKADDLQKERDNRVNLSMALGAIGALLVSFGLALDVEEQSARTEGQWEFAPIFAATGRDFAEPAGTGLAIRFLW